MANISKVSERTKLKPRREPYWAKVSKGCFVGFRKMAANTDGTWLARNLDETSGKQQFKPLGDFTELADYLRFDAAAKSAQEWFTHLGKGGSNQAMTVADACTAYVKKLRSTKGDQAADGTLARFERLIFGYPKLANVEIAKLLPIHIESWRTATKDKTATRGRYKDKSRSESTINRDLTPFRAALNHAYKEGHVTSDFAWRSKLEPHPNADKRRDVYLDREQRKKLIDSAEPDIADFIRALCMLPLRPGALAALTVGNFDKRLSVLFIGKDKAGGDRKIHIPDGTAEFFTRLCRDKLPGAYIFTNSSGRLWISATWGYKFKKAAKLAALPSSATAYSLRHSTITDLMHAGVDSLTVAQLSGTSVVMIEKHYGHLTRDRARSALAALAI